MQNNFHFLDHLPEIDKIHFEKAVFAISLTSET
jgi:hypothetical protein